MSEDKKELLAETETEISAENKRSEEGFVPDTVLLDTEAFSAAPGAEPANSPQNNVPLSVEITPEESPVEITPEERPTEITPEELAAEAVDEEAAERQALFAEDAAPAVPEAPPTEEELDLMTEEIDLRAGSSDNRDEFGREVLERNFVNLLTMSKNIVKRLYSRLKNAIFAYQGVKNEYIGEAEYFRKGKEYLYRLTVRGDALEVALAVPSASLDKKIYPHKNIDKEEPRPGLQIVVSASGKQTADRAAELINLVADVTGLLRDPAGTMVAYAEKYPVNRLGVLRGSEQIPPEPGAYDGEEYDDVTEGVIGEILAERKRKSSDETADTPKKKKTGAEELAERKQTANSVKAALALQEPIVYYYDVAVDKEGAPAYVNVTQTLNDKFLGKLLPPQYFAVAEGSERIEDLNLLAVRAAAEDCNRYPDLLFAVAVSCRLLLKEGTLTKLIKQIKTERDNLVLALDASLLEATGEVGVKAVAALRQNGAKILLDNTENAGMRALTDFEYEFLRFDRRYYAETDKKKAAHLQMIAAYAKAVGVRTVASAVPSVKDAVLLLTKGVDAVEGYLISEPKRIVQTALKERKKLPPIRG